MPGRSAGNEKREPLAPPTFDDFEAGSRITALAPVARSPGRCRVRIGRRALCVVREDEALAAGARVGTLWTPALASALAELASLDATRREALRSLARRGTSAARLVQALRRRGAPAPIAQRAASEMAELGALDELAFAQSVVAGALRARPAGAMLLRQKLRQRGVSDEIAHRVIHDALEGRDLAAEALDLAKSRARRMPASLDHQAKARRLLGLLARRGFDAGASWAAVRAALGTHDNDGGDDPG